MACFKPLKAYRSNEQNPSGKYSIVFNPGKQALRPAEISCGQCIGCRLNRSKNWAIRLMHEASLHSQNSFITLTYSPENLPPNSSLQLPHFQKFLKKLRKNIYPKKIRFFHCGEYGETTLRPHYHAILFNHDFSDKILFKQDPENPLYSSKTLDKIWGLGFTTIGAVTFESAAYVARYILKKVTGQQAESHYQREHPLTGEIIDLTPEYVTMSRRPGLGKAWFDKYKTDVYPDDFVLLRGKKMTTPKYYDSQLEKLDPLLHEAIKLQREVSKTTNRLDNTPERLEAKEELAFINLTRNKRKYESGT